VVSETFPLISIRADRVKRRQPIQHVVAAMLLVYTGYDHLQHSAHVALPVAEIVAGLTLIALVATARFRQRSEHGGMAWVELAGAGMMFVEAIAKLEERHHRSFYVLSFVAPTVLLLFALFDAQINAMRRMKADEERFEMRVHLFWRRAVRWEDISSWSRSPDAIDMKLRDGGTKHFRFKAVGNREAAMDWAVAQFTRRGAAEDLPGSERDSRERDQPPELIAGERRSD
jgi:hypothetical protein